jgi:hypothetical protein
MKTALRWTIILVVGGFFLVAGLSKLSDTSEFARAILRYQLVGPAGAMASAVWLPWAEVLCALSLCSARFRLAAAWLILGMLLLFEVALLAALVRGLDINCGCLGTIVDSGVSFSLVRNLVFMTGLVVLVRTEPPLK